MTLSNENQKLWNRYGLTASNGTVCMSVPALDILLDAARSEPKPPLEVEEVARIIREQLVDEQTDLANPHWGTKRPDVLLAGCKAVGYPRPEEAASEFAKLTAQAILSKLQGGEGGPAQSQPLTDAGTPAPRSHVQPLSDGKRELDAKHWEVDVRLDGESILTLGYGHLAGIPDIDRYDDVLRLCADHLRAFAGPEEPAPCFICGGFGAVAGEAIVGNGVRVETSEPCPICAPPADTTLSGAQGTELSRSAPDEPPLPTPPPEEG